MTKVRWMGLAIAFVLLFVGAVAAVRLGSERIIRQHRQVSLVITPTPRP